jgi:chaperonin GroES
MSCWIEPMAFNVVVEIDKAETVTKGGIILPDSKTERERLACEEGVLVAISPLAFSYADWPEGARKPQVGDRVMVNRFAGMLRENDGKDYRIIEDKSLVAVLREG